MISRSERKIKAEKEYMKGFQIGHKAWNKGIKHTSGWRTNQSEVMKNSGTASARGRLGAISRWGDKVAMSPKEKAERTKENLRRWLSKNPEKSYFANRLRRTRLKGAGGTHRFEDWEALKAYYKFMCLCCKRVEPEIKLTEDHIIPISKGGSNDITNIQPLCLGCNSRKHTQTISYLPVNDAVTGSFKSMEGRQVNQI